MSLISRLKAVVAGDDYLDDDFDDLEYGRDTGFDDGTEIERNYSSGLSPLSNANPFNNRGGSSNVIGMPGISSTSSE